jgi:uncharacterized protein (DUF2062 family)
MRERPEEAAPAARSKKEIVRAAWRRLRGGELTPGRAAASVAVGLAIGVTPLWGVHWALVLAVCLPLRLDAGVAYLASNISLPFIAPFITFAEIEVGARVLRGAWMELTKEEAAQIDPRSMVAELALGTLVVALAASGTGAAIAYAVTRTLRRKREPPA